MSMGILHQYTDTQVSITLRKDKKVNKIMGISIEHDTNITYEDGDRCVRIWKRREMRIHVYIHIRRLGEMKRNEKEFDPAGIFYAE